jgi:phage terminase small subunit
MTHLPVRGRDRVVELAADGRAVPDSPAELTPRGAEIWRELWAAPVAALWTSSDAGLVRRLVVLRERLESDPSASAALYSAALRIETHLGLTPASRLALGVRLAADDEPPPRSNGRRRLTARQRDRILRG